MSELNPRSRRGRILNNLIRQLKTISVANGYATNVCNVTTEIRNWAETPAAETPVIYIVDMGGRPQYFPSRLTEWTWTLHLTGLMKDQTQIQMEEMVSDIEDCLFANGTLAFDAIYPGPAAQIRIQQVLTDGQLMRELDGSQLFTVTIEVKYTASAFKSR